MSLERVDAPSNILEKINISATANVVDPAHDPEKMSLALAAGLLLAMTPMLGGVVDSCSGSSGRIQTKSGRYSCR